MKYICTVDLHINFSKNEFDGVIYKVGEEVELLKIFCSPPSNTSSAKIQAISEDLDHIWAEHEIPLLAFNHCFTRLG